MNDETTAKVSTVKKPGHHYVDNEKFYQELVKYKSACKEAKKKKMEKPPIPNYIGECFLKIAKGMSNVYKFINYTNSYKDEMISDGIENCVTYMDNFDPVKYKNPFAYFSQIIYFAFLRRIQKEKKELYTKYKAIQQMGVLDDQEFMETEDGISMHFELYDNISEFIADFEESKRKKKEKESAVKKPRGIEKFVKE